MRTTSATDSARRHTSTLEYGARARSSDPPRGASIPRRLEQALAEVERLTRELARSQQRADDGPRRREEALLKAALLEIGRARRSDCAIAPPLPCISTRHAIDAALFMRPDPATPGSTAIVWARSRIPKGQVLYRAGDRLDALYAVRFGSFKTELLARSGQDQVVGFHMIGDVVGTDGIASEFQACQATALEDAEVFRIPLERIRQRAQLDPSFAKDFHKLLSQESAHAHTVMLVLGSMLAEQRLAFFVLDMSERYQARGYSACEYMLRMSRQEIGSYLGLKLETVSRLFSRFHREGLLQIRGRSIQVRDRAALMRRAEGG